MTEKTIIAIESSCDETAVAVTRGRTVLSNVIASQVEEHKLYGGVVPEIASRRHAEAIYGLTEQAIEDAKITREDIDAVAVTTAPGLIGALLVGVNFAKGLAKSLDVPLIPVHHLRGHIAANYITAPHLKPPFLCLLVSGGNSVVAYVKDYTDFEILARTRDDAAGECFDKAARAMGLSYPGGVTLDKIATIPDFKKYPLPFPKVEDSDYDFSFSGLKTAVINTIHNAEQKGEKIDVPVMAATLRRRVCDMLVHSTFSLAEEKNIKTVVIAGGVSANSELRSRMKEEAEKRKIALYYPELCYCGDNAAMIGVQAAYETATADSTLNARATMGINESF
ncbi:MAG: tRNA (adenosine(37)-N6)-threonylcarbamoyltransferase complex transferase subunit TsaD [Acutalibacteraceae bacterium]|nr:tRNA (adenosine(37)-N6)-threonylcarbamoyltransferase complex transferase subunit TsaD [Acutalibacteraceae bacterium]